MFLRASSLGVWDRKQVVAYSTRPFHDYLDSLLLDMSFYKLVGGREWKLSIYTASKLLNLSPWWKSSQHNHKLLKEPSAPHSKSSGLATSFYSASSSSPVQIFSNYILDHDNPVGTPATVLRTTAHPHA